MTPAPPKTRRGTPKLSDVARHLAVPSGITSTGWPAVRDTCNNKLGVTFDDWQDGAGKVILAKRGDGKLAATIDGVGMSLPRQVGKTTLIGATVFALCINTPGLLVIWSAHHARTHEETFLAMQGFAKRAKVAPHVAKVFTGSGDEEVRFHNGSRILFGARERGFGRGIPGVDVLVFDEAQILSDRAMSNMLATMNTSQLGLHLYIGTPPKPTDQSETFSRMRRSAIAGTLENGAWIEFGADPDAKSDDRAQWRRANPSHPVRTPVESILRLRSKLTEGDFRREALGIWDADRADGTRLVGPEQWAALHTDTVPTDGIRCFGVAFNLDGSRASLAGAVRHSAGVHLELIDVLDGLAWIPALAEWLAQRRHEAAEIRISGKSGAQVLHQALRDQGVPAQAIKVATTEEYYAANGMFLVDVHAKAITVPTADPSDYLERSAAISDRKARGQSGAWGWDATVPGGDETPMEAISLALYAAKTTRRRPGRKQEVL